MINKKPTYEELVTEIENLRRQLAEKVHKSI